MFYQLTKALTSFDDSLIPEEIADVIWLAAQLPVQDSKDITNLQLKGTTPEGKSSSKSESGTPKKPLPDKSKDPEQNKLDGLDYEDTEPVPLLPKIHKSGSLSFRTPAAPALPHALELIRPLRLLKRKVPSKWKRVLDEQASINYIAASGLWLPILKPAKVRWLDLALVIDASPSLHIWHRTIAAFKKLLERQGAFRNVRTWSLDITKEDKVTLHYGQSKSVRNSKGSY